MKKRKRIISHPYTRLLKHLHDVCDIKVQLNLFYQNETFSFDRMSEKFKKEWIANSNWLKLSFHSLSETVFPYEKSDYEEVFEDCMKV